MTCLNRFFCLVLVALLSVSAWAQRPDAGILSQPQERLQAPLKKGNEPAVTLPAPQSGAPSHAAVSITPAGFRLTGNTVFSSDELLAVIASAVNQPTDLSGLNAAAAKVARYYKERGYLLTEAYLPEQAFAASGGVVTIAVIEARIGHVYVRFESEGLARSFVQDMVATHLKPQDLISEYSLDKPVLLLRDLTGYEASANVEPGTQFGQADVTINVKAAGARVDGSLGLDNAGTSTAGAHHAFANLNINNLSGRGDAFNSRFQLSNQAGSNLYRLSYTLPVGNSGTRMGVTTAHTQYALGGEFEALGASGDATITGLALTQPFIRSRRNNLYGLLSFEHKDMHDQVSTPSSDSKRQISSTRIGLLGNFVDALAGGSALNTYTLSLTMGRLRLDSSSLNTDQATGGLNTAGGFNKFNVDYQREQYFSAVTSVLLSLQAQVASRNLASAEKMSLGGPSGVRGYPLGEGVGDAGAMLNLEYRHVLPLSTPVGPIQVLAFYDKAWTKFNQMGASPTGASNHINLGSVGVGARVGQEGQFLLSAQLAWRTTDTLPSNGDSDRSPRVWVAMQKWF